MSIIRHPGAPLLLVSQQWLRQRVPVAYRAFMAAVREAATDKDVLATSAQIRRAADSQVSLRNESDAAYERLRTVRERFFELALALRNNGDEYYGLSLGSYDDGDGPNGDALFFYWSDGYLLNQRYGQAIMRDQAMPMTTTEESPKLWTDLVLPMSVAATPDPMEA